MAKETNEILNEKSGTLGFIITLVCIAGVAVVLGISQNWIAMALSVVIAGFITYIHFELTSYVKLVIALIEKCDRLTREQTETGVRLEQFNLKLTTLSGDVRQAEEVSANALNEINDRRDTKKEKYVRPTTAKVVAVEAQAEPIIVNQAPDSPGTPKIKRKKKTTPQKG